MKKYIRGFFMAWGNFFWIPCPSKKWDEEARSIMLSWLPTIGLFIAAIWYAVYYAMLKLGLGYMIMSVLLTYIPFKLSGFMHVEGFMDCADALSSCRDIEGRQKILKDPHVGSFAVIKVIFVVLFYFAGISIGVLRGIDPVNLGLIVIVPRFISVLEVMMSEPMGSSQYSGMEQKGLLFLLVQMLVYFALSALFCQYLLPTGTVLLTSLIGSLLSITIAKKKLGGMNGDIAGFGIVWGELLGVLTLVII